MRAFNYDLQQWDDGPAAVAIVRAQAQAELRSLRGPRGEEFARWSRIPDRDLAIARLECQLIELWGC